MTMLRKAAKTTRGAMIGVLAAGAVLIALPGAAAAGPKAREITERLISISDQIYDIEDIRGLYRKEQEIDRLQARLSRLDRISKRQKSRRARNNRKDIYRLQHRLRKIERRVGARIVRREERRDAHRDWQRDWRRDHRERLGRGYGHDHYRGYQRPAIVIGGGGWN